MDASSTDHRRILRELVSHDVEFVIVGGIAAVLQGAPIVTFDLDIVHARDHRNVARLLDALHALDARSRLHPGVTRADASHLAGSGHVLLTTLAGDLDVLGAVGHGRDHASLLPFTHAWEIEPCLVVRVLDLATLIDVKREAGRPKDAAALPVLHAALQERDRRGG